MSLITLGSQTFGLPVELKKSTVAHNELILTATIYETDGTTEADVSADTAIKLRKSGDTSDTISKTQADAEVSVTGAGSNEVTVTFTATDMDIDAGDYDLELRCGIGGGAEYTIAVIRLSVSPTLFT